MELDIPNSVVHLINVARTQADVVSALSAGGIGFVLLTWLRVHGMSTDINLTAFRRPILLIFPLILFLAAYIAGYVLSLMTAGYFAEVATAYSTSNATSIANAKQHFIDDYFDLLQCIGFLQLGGSVLGVVSLATWFVFNLTLVAHSKGKT